MGAKRRKKSGGPGVVSEYRADYREHVLSVPETEEEPEGSLDFSMDYREGNTAPGAGKQEERPEENREDAQIGRAHV